MSDSLFPWQKRVFDHWHVSTHNYRPFVVVPVQRKRDPLMEFWVAAILRNQAIADARAEEVKMLNEWYNANLPQGDTP